MTGQHLIVVSGWRRHPDPHAIFDALDGRWRAHRGGPFVVMHGACPTGADQYADHWCCTRGVPVWRRPAADFGRWPWCGPRRNAAMVAEAADVRATGGDGAVEVLAFPQPDWETARRCGTRDLIRKAQAVGFVPQILAATLPKGR